MKKIIRLTEDDLTRLIKRVINEESKVMMDKVPSSRNIIDSNIPCIKRKFVFPTYKITDPRIVNKFQGISSTPILSEKNVLVYDKSNLSMPEKKYGNVTLYSNGSKMGNINLDGTSIGSELYIITDVNMVDQGSDMFKIGWVFCNGQLYIYDMVGEAMRGLKL